ncbi:uncharacterized protein LY89DRAFT_674033 [Mollisia scopiformis]|uniref:Uncharacterized protein n=1 Tax=Mollisia scopiformis TaxID=149040 RepID=A0A194WV17_MOLSC|nr:uncharacterized protein LY89DRAFT_674033 [Mollisia scopiformis]KUJ11437.1 hypothetical protein LY89DRAFT_674033 [Mollisia scopiformis]
MAPSLGLSLPLLDLVLVLVLERRQCVVLIALTLCWRPAGLPLAGRRQEQALTPVPKFVSEGDHQEGLRDQVSEGDYQKKDVESQKCQSAGAGAGWLAWLLGCWLACLPMTDMAGMASPQVVVVVVVVVVKRGCHGPLLASISSEVVWWVEWRDAERD